jgi:hypothetical protein
VRYLILRRNVRTALLLTLLAVSVASAAPWAYSRFFIDKEDVAGSEALSQAMNLPDFFGGSEIDKPISLDLNFLNDGYLSSELHIEALNLKGLIISGDIFIKGRFADREDTGKTTFIGKLFSDNISIDSAPFMPVKALFEITGDTLEINSLSLGKAYELKGRVGLKAPFESDLRLDIKRADIKDLVLMVKKKKPLIAMGMMNGVFYIKGNLSNIYSNGILESRNGRAGKIDYDIATIRIEGFGPIINIVDSKLKWGKSLLTVDGYMDLRTMDKGNLFDGLRVKSDMKTIVWDGWDIDQKGKDGLSMSKDISDNMRVGFKAFAREPLTPYRDTENPEEMSLEYKLGAERLKMKLKDNEEFFGIEHSVRF